MNRSLQALLSFRNIALGSREYRSPSVARLRQTARLLDEFFCDCSFAYTPNEIFRHYPEFVFKNSVPDFSKLRNYTQTWRPAIIFHSVLVNNALKQKHFWTNKFLSSDASLVCGWLENCMRKFAFSKLISAYRNLDSRFGSWLDAIRLSSWRYSIISDNMILQYLLLCRHFSWMWPHTSWVNVNGAVIDVNLCNDRRKYIIKQANIIIYSWLAFSGNARR